MLVVDEGLSQAILSNVFVGQSKESLKCGRQISID